MDRIDRLTKVLLAVLIVGVWGLLLQSAIGYWRVEAQSKKTLDKKDEIQSVIRTRGVVIVDEQNRERLHFIADKDGGAMIRFLNRKTSVPGWIRLGEDDKLYMEFIDVQKDKNKVIKKKLSFDGQETTEEPFSK